jgi:predicted RNA-binding protein (virulence factor B family)
MLNIGKFNTLKVSKIVDFGLFLDGGNKIEILLPARYVTQTPKIGDELEVFIYSDSEDRLIATTEKPFTQVGEFTFLEVKSVNKVGAFLNWGLMKDLLVPFNEQRSRMKEGRRYLVYTYLDDATKRIVASSKFEKFLGNTIPSYKKGDTVNGYKILNIVKDSVTVKLGANVYKAGIGEILTEGELNYNEVSNLNNKFGGVQ